MKFKNQYTKILNILLLLLFVFLLISLFIPEISLARPGGGHSYSGGGSSGGSGDGIAGLIIWLLLSLPPEISIPLVIIILIFFVISKRKQKKNPTITSTPTVTNQSRALHIIESKIQELKNQDSGFSKVLFLDFATSLYHKFYNYYGNKDLDIISPFFAQNIIEPAKKADTKRIYNEIVIGNISITDIGLYPQYTAITVDIEANYTVSVGGKATRYITTERWLFNRKAGVTSQEPEKMQKITCPNCGAPTNFTDAGKCNHCETFIEKGEMQWFVKDRAILSQQVFKTQHLLSYSQEVGTNFPTIVQPDIENKANQFAMAHNQNWSTYWNNFQNDIIKNYFNEIYAAWDRQRWDEVRHLISDRLWETNNYWQEAYKKAQYKNRLEKLNIKRIDLARVDRDTYYEALTVRIFAGVLDYVTDKNGRLLAGSNKQIRYFSEYWTFIRRTGVEKENFNLKTCPSCGAPADKMGQAGECEYCGSKVSTGEFSWVLSVITQDEVYKG